MEHKRKLFVFAVYSILIFTSQLTIAQSGWFKQNITLYNRDLMLSVQFVNPNTGHAVGAGGTIIKTTNAGINWVTQSPDTSGVFYSVFFVNENTGYIGGQNYVQTKGKILKTINGGMNWNTVLYWFTGKWNFKK